MNESLYVRNIKREIGYTDLHLPEIVKLGDSDINDCTISHISESSELSSEGLRIEVDKILGNYGIIR